MGVIAVLVSGVFAGFAGSVSAFIGAVAYCLPNAIFALRLLLGLASCRANALTFFAGQFVKVALVVAALMLAGWLADAWLVWPALVFGLCSVLMGYVLLPCLARMRPGQGRIRSW